MITFFKHKKFWMPIAILATLAFALELCIRLGWWDKYLKPSSFLGYAVSRHHAIEEFGLDKIDWITLGDSVIDWGINHKLILENQKQQHNLNHLRMSFPQSGLFAFQTTSSWSSTHMPNLKGIMLGVSNYKLTRFSAPDRVLSISWPFRHHADYEKYQYTEANGDLFSRIFTHFSLFVYFADIKDFLQNPLKRLNKIKKTNNQNFPDIFHFSRNVSRDLCKYQLETLDDCISSAKQIISSNKAVPTGMRTAVNYCRSQSARHRQDHPEYRPQIPKEQVESVTQNWKNFFKELSAKKINILLVLLPEHPFFDYYKKFRNQDQMVDEILDTVKIYPQIQVLDLRSLLHKPMYNTCEYYSDVGHFNNRGNEVITSKIIEWFNQAN